MTSKQVLVTGSSGTIGRVAVQALQARGHRVRGFDRVAHPTLADQVVGLLTDEAAIARAVSGCHAVIHLAATPDQADFVSDLVPNNLVGPWLVLEAARAAGVERVVLASTIRVGFLHDWHRNVVRVGDGFAPHDGYSLTKAAGELMGELFARRYGMTVLCARFGWVVRSPDEVKAQLQGAWHSGILLSQDDAGRYLVACVDNPLSFRTAHRFAAMYVTSRPPQQTAVDLSEARSVTGYEPQDVWPQGSPWVELYRQVRGG
jgi:nucleoside-diphosphate-sugar epimerase